MKQPSNRAAYLISAKGEPLEVRDAPYTPPGANEIVVRNAAVAINPVDWFKQVTGNLMFNFIKYPYVIGNDVAGVVEQVGSGVTRFKPGDRVLGHACSLNKNGKLSAEGAFQNYTLLRANVVAHIPADMSFERAVVIPLCLSTAASGLFDKKLLALRRPTVAPVKPTGETVLVWGGASSVGCNAIQLAVAAGYEVFTTASPANFEYVQRLGAARVFDYRSATVVADIIEAMKGKRCAGALALANAATGPCIDVLGAVEGRKFVAQASAPAAPSKDAKGFMATAMFVAVFLWGAVGLFVKAKLKGVGMNFIMGGDVAENEVGAMVYEGFLEEALARKEFKAAPEPMVVGHGLEKIQEAMDVHKAGVSAKKVVVML